MEKVRKIIENMQKEIEEDIDIERYCNKEVKCLDSRVAYILGGYQMLEDVLKLIEDKEVGEINKYDISIIEKNYGSIEIGAKNKEEAKQKALRTAEDGMIMWNTCEVEIKEIYEYKL